MTSPTLADAPVAPRSRALMRVAAVLATLLALFDLVGVLMYLGAPVPLFLNVTIVVLALATIVGAIFAWRGALWGAWVAAIARALSIVPMLPVVLGGDGVPAEAAVPTWIQLGVTVVVVVLLVVGAVRRGR